MGIKSRFYISAAVLAAGVGLNAGNAFGQIVFDPGALTSDVVPTVVTSLPDAYGSGWNLVSNTGTPLLFGPNTAGYNHIFDGTDQNTSGPINYIQFNNSSLITDPTSNPNYPDGSDGNILDDQNNPQPGKYSILIIYANEGSGTNQLAGNSVFSLQSTATSDPEGVTSNGTILSNNGSGPGTPQTTNQLTFALLTHSITYTNLYQAYGDGPVVGYTLVGPNAPYPPTQTQNGSITQAVNDLLTAGGTGNVDIAGIAIIGTDSDPGDAQGIIESAQAQFLFDTPEPASLSLLGLGALGLLARRRKA